MVELLWLQIRSWTYYPGLHGWWFNIQTMYSRSTSYVQQHKHVLINKRRSQCHCIALRPDLNYWMILLFLFSNPVTYWLYIDSWEPNVTILNVFLSSSVSSSTLVSTSRPESQSTSISQKMTLWARYSAKSLQNKQPRTTQKKIKSGFWGLAPYTDVWVDCIVCSS